MIDFDVRLSKLKDRRQGIIARNQLEKSFYAMDSRPTEDHERLNDISAIKYVIGAMAPVSPASTQISIKEGERVASTLISSLQTAGIPAEMRMQGSVALDIHIEGHSDVDMLILRTDSLTTEKPVVDPTRYISCAYGKSAIEILQELRYKSEAHLSSRYHAADIDTTKGKCISLTGGSLQRKVDIVPSTWHDTSDYQRTYLEKFRAVNVYDKTEHRMHANKPFLHISRVNSRDAQYGGNLKKVIRLLKNIVADMPDYKKTKVKKLTSYDIAGIAYAMDSKLSAPRYFPLVLLDQLRTFLMIQVYLEEQRNKLWVPDDTRMIFDSSDKVEALRILYAEVSDLVMAVQKSLKPDTQEYDKEILVNRPVFI